jgi:hypothetical protein
LSGFVRSSRAVRNPLQICGDGVNLDRTGLLRPAA